MKQYYLTDVIRFIFEVERGEKPLTPLMDPMKVLAGNVEYTAPGGWKIVVFNDCQSWDYIDSITDPSGYVWACPGANNPRGYEVEFFFQYDPPEDVIRNVYRIFDR